MRHGTRVMLGMLASGIVYVASQPRVEATGIYFTLRIGNTINGVDYDTNDIIFYDTNTNASSLFFDGDTVFKKKRVEIDAFDLLSNGHILLSTARNAQIGSLSFTGKDVVDLNRTTKTATLFFDGDTLLKNVKNLEAIDLLPNGHLLFTADTGSIGSLSFTSRDIVEYNPVTGDASLYFKGKDNFKGKKGQITGLDVLDDGELALIIGDAGREAHIGGLDVGRRDIILYNPVSKTATELLNGDDIFERTGHEHDQGFSGVDIPGPVAEPVSFSLFGLGLVGLGLWRRRFGEFA